MICTSCNKEIGDGVKFCRYCGSPVAAATPAVSATVTCPSCQGTLSAGAKFCRYCGSAVTGGAESTAEKAAESVDTMANFVTWHILPGQFAVKIDEADVAAYKTVKGVYVAPGTKALFFENGRFVASLDSGKYPFREIESENATATQRKSGFFRSIADFFSGGGSKGEHFYTVVLVRGVEFPLVYELENVAKQGLRSDIGVHILCKLTNLNDFFDGQLVDKKMVSIKSFADSLMPCVTTLINQVLSQVAPQNVDYNEELANYVLNALQGRFSEIYSYLTVSSVISITAKNEELEKIRKMSEELYVAELELEQLQLRNDYLNRLQSVEHSNELNMAREDVDFRALMDKIDEDRLLGEDKRAQFEEMLRAQAQLRQARSENEITLALDKLEQTELLSSEEIDTLKRAIAHRANMQDAENENILALATIRNKLAQDREKLLWEIEIGNKLHENDLERARMTARFADERRDADFEFEKRKTDHKMDLLRQAQAVREEREQARHQREMEARRMEHDVALEHHKLNATMTFEQIMASNPDISPEAARALGEKFKAEAAMAQNDRAVDLTRQHSEDLKEIMAQQMALTRDILASQNQAKEQELARAHDASERNQDRFLAGMQTTMSAMVNAGKATPAPAPAPAATLFCQNCGKKHPAGTMICDACGNSL